MEYVTKVAKIKATIKRKEHKVKIDNYKQFRVNIA